MRGGYAAPVKHDLSQKGDVEKPTVHGMIGVAEMNEKG
jgi:hypothetical protein